MRYMESSQLGSGDAMANFADRLLDAIDKTQNPICVGLDPEIAHIPEEIKQRVLSTTGPGIEATCTAIRHFNYALIDAIAGLVPVVKPNTAFYERYGNRGICALEATMKHAREKGLIVIADAKRNDIGSTAQAYAEAFLGKVSILGGEPEPALDADAITVNAYPGSDGLKPFVQYCKDGKGVFVLVRMSNPSAKEIQDRATTNHASVISIAEFVADLTHDLGREYTGERGYSAVGAVVGITFHHTRQLRRRMPEAIILGPGYGAQGATGKEAAEAFNEDGYGAIIAASRSISTAHQNPKYAGMSFEEATRTAVREMRRDILQELKRAEKLPKGWSI